MNAWDRSFKKLDMPHTVVNINHTAHTHTLTIYTHGWGLSKVGGAVRAPPLFRVGGRLPPLPPLCLHPCTVRTSSRCTQDCQPSMVTCTCTCAVHAGYPTVWPSGRFDMESSLPLCSQTIVEWGHPAAWPWQHGPPKNVPLYST